jgi:tRNA1(Val) A37 N6-methylase TrmN6
MSSCRKLQEIGSITYKSVNLAFIVAKQRVRVQLTFEKRLYLIKKDGFEGINHHLISNQ